MRMHNSEEKYVTAIFPRTTTASTAVNGNTVTTAVSGGNTNGGIDTKGYRRLVAVVQAGAIATNGGLNVKLQESSDEAASDSYADITGAAIVALGDTSDGAAPSIEIGLDGRERYIRAVGTPLTVDSAAWSVLFILKDAIVEPVTQNTAAVVVNS